MVFWWFLMVFVCFLMVFVCFLMVFVCFLVVFWWFLVEWKIGWLTLRAFLVEWTISWSWFLSKYRLSSPIFGPNDFGFSTFTHPVQNKNTPRTPSATQPPLMLALEPSSLQSARRPIHSTPEESWNMMEPTFGKELGPFGSLFPSNQRGLCNCTLLLYILHKLQKVMLESRSKGSTRNPK